ncbi:hypothetical protein [Burkholderia sp. AU15512]|uniref:hypothetical protein n=1 Tax=Burkholderia sp. AU15512 TaxID=2015345 RepID=UPI00117C0DE1|nr:hypothetical protein [Burkholderia sp. AU15512]
MLDNVAQQEATVSLQFCRDDRPVAAGCDRLTKAFRNINNLMARRRGRRVSTASPILEATHQPTKTKNINRLPAFTRLPYVIDFVLRLHAELKCEMADTKWFELKAIFVGRGRVSWLSAPVVPIAFRSKLPRYPFESVCLDKVQRVKIIRRFGVVRLIES